jgi:hypothetical protein
VPTQCAATATTTDTTPSATAAVKS